MGFSGRFSKVAARADGRAGGRPGKEQAAPEPSAARSLPEPPKGHGILFRCLHGCGVATAGCCRRHALWSQGQGKPGRCLCTAAAHSCDDRQETSRCLSRVFARQKAQAFTEPICAGSRRASRQHRERTSRGSHLVCDDGESPPRRRGGAVNV